MKFLVVLAVAVACVCADVSHVVNRSPDADAQVLRSETDIQPDGQYNYAFEVSNGISQEAKGVFKNVPNAEDPVLEVTGGYRFTGSDGIVYDVKYVADENGFHPTGDHLPVAPEIPELIQRSLDYNAAHPQVENKNENYQRVAPVPVVPAYKPTQVAYKPTQSVFKPFQKKF